MPIGDRFQFLLEGKLHKTDWLIDQIVYKLYGLTEEEIKIVEGQSDSILLTP